MSIADGELETAAAMAAAVRGGAVRSADLVDRALARAEAWQPAANAFSQLWPDEAMEAAHRLDAVPGGPAWKGIPVAVKDLFDVAGHRSTGCSAAYRDAVPAVADAPTVAAIRRAGVVVIGKTNQHELAAGGTNLVSDRGRTGNPWDPDRITGGSSGGSAAAVAAGVVPWALGSDTGGSIRIPASMCGTFGLKPTHGRLPTRGLMPLAPSMDCPGPMAATAEDLRACYVAMGGPDERSVGPIRVGIPDGFFAEFVHRSAREAVSAAAAVLGATGVAMEPCDGHGLDDVRALWLAVCTVEFAAAYPMLAEPERRRLVAPQVAAWLEQGERRSAADRARDSQDRATVARWFEERLRSFDALLVPTTPYPAHPATGDEVDLGDGVMLDVHRVGPGWLSCPVNLAGLPAISLPAGRSLEGLPIGVSLVAGPGREGLLLDLAAAWQAGSGYEPARPPLPRG